MYMVAMAKIGLCVCVCVCVCDASGLVGTVNIVSETILFFMLKNFKSLRPIKGNSVSDCASFERSQFLLGVAIVITHLWTQKPT